MNNILLSQHKIPDAVAAINFSSADERNPQRMTNYLHAISSHSISGNEKITTLVASFTDINLRLIATQCAEKAQEIQEIYKASRKASQKALVSCTPLQKAVEIKRSLAKVVADVRGNTNLHFASPRRSSHSNSRIPDLSRDTCIGLTPLRDLSAEFDATVMSVSSADRDMLAARLETEAIRSEVSHLELEDAAKILEREQRAAQQGSVLHSVKAENEAIDSLFKLSCILLLKYASYEDISKFQLPGTARFNWELDPVKDVRLHLTKLSEILRTKSYGDVTDSMTAHPACHQFVLDLAKYEWVIGLFSDPASIRILVGTFKQIAGAKIESLLRGNEVLLKNSALDNHAVASGSQTLFDFYKHRLGVINVSPGKRQDGKSAHFLQNAGIEPAPSPQHPQGIIRALGSSSRPISSDPNGDCYHETRTDSQTRSTEIQTKFRPSTPGPYGRDSYRKRRRAQEPSDTEGSASDFRDEDSIAPSGDDSDWDKGHNSKRPRFRSHSRSRERPSRSDPASREDDIPRRSARIQDLAKDPKVLRLLEKAVVRAGHKLHSSQRDKSPSGNRTPDLRYPRGACAALVSGKINCPDANCVALHGCFHSKDNQGIPTKQCEFETGGKSCPYLWMRNGCFYNHLAPHTRDLFANPTRSLTAPKND